MARPAAANPGDARLFVPAAAEDPQQHQEEVDKVQIELQGAEYGAL